MDRPLKLAREEQMLDQTQANRLLLRNLAHEIKNPLGGIRGAAQLLEQELENRPARIYPGHRAGGGPLALADGKTAQPANASHYSALNIHEVLERVRSVVLAEMPGDLKIQRDYDISLPALVGDKEQLIQVMLNIVRNAAQAMQGQRQHHPAHPHRAPGDADQAPPSPRVMVQIIDNGPASRRSCRTRSSIRWCRGAPMGMAWG